VFQNKEKEKRADELIIANKEKAKRAAEFIVAKKEKEKEKEKERLIIINEKLNKLIIESKQAEEALRESEEKFSKAFMTSPYAITITNPKDGKFIEVSDAFTSIAGYTRKEALADSSVGMNLWVNEKDRDQVVNELFEGKEVAGKEFLFNKKNGELITGLFSAHIIKLNNEPYILSSINDITERKNAELALLESEKKFSDTVKYLDEGYYSVTVDGILLEHNLAFNRIIGIDITRDMKGEKSPDFWQNPNERNEYLKELMTNGIINNYEVGAKTISNEKITVILNSHLIKDEDDKLLRIEGTVLDITERKRLEEVMRENMSKFKTLVENIPQKVFVKDLNYKWVFINEKLAHDLKIKPEEVVGKMDSDLFPKELADKYHADDIRIIETGQTEEIEEKYIEDGKEKFISTIKTPIKDENGKIIGVFGIFWDITERRQAEELLKITLENLERSNKELEQFAYVASHDLQEPLRMVSSYTQLIERRYKDKLDQDANDFIQFAVDGANRMQKLINDLLDYSRISSKGKDYTKIDISQVLGQAISNLQQLIIDNTALITNEDLPVLIVDESQIIRVFQNLIENAIKFKNKTELPKIHISCKKQHEFYEFAVRDNGIGIEMQYHDKVFTIFQRLHSKEEYSGTGIGLSICKRIVERHGGKIWFESKENEGTTFYFTLKK
jgi:PAS domain S-box-containing protein